jgi:hypothetical protein
VLQFVVVTLSPFCVDRGLNQSIKGQFQEIVGYVFHQFAIRSYNYSFVRLRVIEGK